jgi:hypothetical protein
MNAVELEEHLQSVLPFGWKVLSVTNWSIQWFAEYDGVAYVAEYYDGGKCQWELDYGFTLKEAKERREIRRDTDFGSKSLYDAIADLETRATARILTSAKVVDHLNRFPFP